MELPLSCIERRVQKIKKNIFSSNFDIYSFVCFSTYDTAWLAMIPDSKYPSQPMFKNYLEWLIKNQKPEGFWGESDTIECLPATIVSMVALTKWNTGTLMVEKGRSFIDANIDKLLNEVKDECPRWLAIVLPAIIELADIVGLDLHFQQSTRDTMSYINNRRKSILKKEEVAGDFSCYAPLLSYLEALPPSYFDEKDICKNLSEDGSLFQSPSATAKAFMDYGNKKCLSYLQALSQRCPKAVPQAYSMEEDYIKLCIANQLHRFGLGEYFVREIEVLLSQVYRNYNNEASSVVRALNKNTMQLQKDAMAFELLRTYGFKVSPLRFCWFLNHDETKAEIENNYEQFSSAMFHVFRASNLMFCGEYELEEARSFSRKILEKIVSTGKRGLSQQIEHELSLPWFARLDHLEHRMWIEETEANTLWKGKTSHNRVSCLYNDELLQLASLSFEFKQLIYKNELKEIKRWAEKYGMSDMGFGREKSTYCYFAAAASLTSLPHDSYVRMFVAKTAIIITVADDFFDSVGSLNELEILTEAVLRWDTRGLSSHSKVIFDALDDLISEATRKYLQQEGTSDDISRNLKDLWYEIFLSWLIEANWSRNGHKPSIDHYLETGMTSIGAHLIVLSSSCFMKPFEKHRLKPYEPLTNLLMVISRLLNDLESYQKEMEEGKLNYVLVNMMENPEFEIEDSIAFVREIVEKKKKEFLELVLIDGLSDFPKPSKQLHLSCLKVFQMFFNSKNSFDSNTDMVEDINKAIYLPLSRTSMCLSTQKFPKKKHIISKIHMNFPLKHYSKISFNGMRLMTPKIGIGFI
ncbi:(E,E)-geranyllinalool synthase-like [Vicia villosa]|uniref:(E,E)-geranyllinalool synthase-like n=1 Tax=Vicia villosa TaxID=3911 RepID=UPI00273B7CCE|nr:(E,E)-geranyllinalool synthase-like [Vicia villosa]